MFCLLTDVSDHIFMPDSNESLVCETGRHISGMRYDKTQKTSIDLPLSHRFNGHRAWTAKV